MAFNPKQLPETSGGTYETMPTDLYPARVARILELGYQEDQYGIKRKVVFGFTIPDQMITIKDDNGNEVQKQKMLWTFPINLPESQNADAKINKYINAINGDMEGWEDLLNGACMLDVVEKEITRNGKKQMVNNIEGITRAPRSMQVAEPDCDVFLFDFYSPDLSVWEKLSENRQEQIKKASDYQDSALQALVEGHDAPA